MITMCTTSRIAKMGGRFAASAATAFMLATGLARVYGAAVAFDSAADPAYNLQPGEASGWLQLSNGGYGFGPWVPASGNPMATNPAGMIGSSTTNGSGDLDNDGDINTPRNASGRAWGFNVPAASGNASGIITNPRTGARRMLQGQLTVGQTFSVDFDNGFLANPVINGMHYPGEALWTIENSASLDGFDFIARADLPDYQFGGMDTGVPLTTEGVHCEFTFMGQNPPLELPIPWELKITPLPPGGQTHVITGLWTTDIRFLPDRFDFVDDAAGGDPANSVYINNLSVTNVPEPGGCGPALVASALLLRRWRRRADARRKAARRVESSTARSAAQETGGGNDERADEVDGSKTRDDATAGPRSRPVFFAVDVHARLPVAVWAWVCRGGELASQPVARGNAGAVVTADGGLPLLKIYVTTVCNRHPPGDEGVRG